MMTTPASIGLADLPLLGMQVPIVTLVIAVLAGAAVWLFASLASNQTQSAQASEGRARSAVRARHGIEQLIVAAAAIAVATVFAVELVLRGYVFPDSERVAWWRIATPLLAGAVGIGILLLVLITRGSRRPEEPVAHAGRRTLATFSPAGSIAGALIAAGALVVTTIMAGSAAWVDDVGRSAWVEMPVPNESHVDPIRVPFYGWSFGAPALAGLAALIIVAALALRANALRPFLRPETVAAERRARRGIAAGITHIATASVLLSLGGAWRMIAQVSSVSSVAIDGVNDGVAYEVTWRYAELGAIAGWCAPLLEVVAFALLALAAQVRRPWATTTSRLDASTPSPVPAR